MNGTASCDRNGSETLFTLRVFLRLAYVCDPVQRTAPQAKTKHKSLVQGPDGYSIQREANLDHTGYVLRSA